MAGPAHLFGRDDAFIIVAPGPDTYTTPALTANLVLRVTLASIANIVCFIPLRHLYRNGEFAATVFIANIMVKNFDTIVNALIWRTDNTDNWWVGIGLCDISPYVRNFTIALFVTCLLAIMRNLAQQVGLLRANPLTVREKRRRNLIQALIMFPLPIIQLAWIWPLTGQRFVVGTLVGCSWVAYPSWPYVVFFILAPVVVALWTAGYAILVYIRFREVAKTTQSALNNNRLASIRAQRTKRRLYLMVISILAPFLPIIIALLVLNMLDASPIRAFDYNDIHNQSFPYPWNTIVFLPSNSIGFAYMNINYIPILSTVPVFVFFGMTKDAMNSYRRGLLQLGLGRVFPILHQEYDPDRSAYGESSYGSRMTSSTSTTTRSAKLKAFFSPRSLSTTSTASGESPQRTRMNLALSTNNTSVIDAEEGRSGYSHFSRPEPQPQPQLQLQTTHPLAQETIAQEITAADLPHRNPFLFRTRLDFPIPFRLPFFHPKPKPEAQDRPVPLESLPSFRQPNWGAQPSPQVQTRVWSDDEVGLFSDSPPEARGSPDSASVVVETQVTRETYQR